MKPIVPNHRPAHARPYAWGNIEVNPDPPRVGEVTRISFSLANADSGELVVEQIDVRIAAFGMGVPWEQLDPIGPFILPPDVRHVEEATAQWIPTKGGHCCVRAYIHVRDLSAPLVVGRNLEVIQAGERESEWCVPFRLGNPDAARAPIVLQVGGNDAMTMTETAVRIAGRIVAPGQPVWLEPGETVQGELVLAALPGPALDTVHTVEAYAGGRLIDGIQVEVKRPALTRRQARPATDGARYAHRGAQGTLVAVR
jgi:hypothetical protein